MARADVLLKHGLIYFLARGGSGLINFLAIAIYTRLLSPDDYGRYALVVAGAGFADLVFFLWLRLALLRFLPARSKGDFGRFLGTILVYFLISCSVLTLIALLAFVLLPSLRQLIFLGLLLAWSQAWFELNVELMRVHLQPWRYGFLINVRSLLSVVLGLIAIKVGFGVQGLVLGLAMAYACASMWGIRGWKGVQLFLDQKLGRALLAYSLPLSATFLLTFVVNASDRFLLALLGNEGLAGQYAASYDLANQTIILLLIAVNLAGYPLVVHSLENQGIEAARRQVLYSGIFLMATGLPSALFLALFSSQIAYLLGVSFRDTGAAIFPWVAIAALLNGLRAYFFDLAFQLGRWTRGQVWVAVLAAMTNLGLNLWWIPSYGPLGAAWATVVAYAVALGASFWLGRYAFPIPVPWVDWLKIILSTLVMALALKSIFVFANRAGLPVPVSFLLSLVFSGFIYVSMLLSQNVGGLRGFLRNAQKGRRE